MTVKVSITFPDTGNVSINDALEGAILTLMEEDDDAQGDKVLKVGDIGRAGDVSWEVTS